MQPGLSLETFFLNFEMVRMAFVSFTSASLNYFFLVLSLPHVALFSKLFPRIMPTGCQLTQRASSSYCCEWVLEPYFSALRVVRESIDLS